MLARPVIRADVEAIGYWIVEADPVQQRRAFVDFDSDTWTADFYLADFLYARDRQRISDLSGYSRWHQKDRRKLEANRATYFLHRLSR